MNFSKIHHSSVTRLQLSFNYLFIFGTVSAMWKGHHSSLYCCSSSCQSSTTSSYCPLLDGEVTTFLLHRWRLRLEVCSRGRSRNYINNPPKDQNFLSILWSLASGTFSLKKTKNKTPSKSHHSSVSFPLQAQHQGCISDPQKPETTISLLVRLIYFSLRYECVNIY